MRTIVLGVAVYPTEKTWANVDLLARSMAMNDPDSELVLVTAPLGREDRSLFDRFNVRAIELADAVPVFDRSTPEGKAKQHAWICQLFGSRHAWYLTALAALNTTHVLLADTRDVVVTGRLARKTSEQTLVLSMENAHYTLGAELWNAKWLQGSYGAEITASLHDKPILCAGTVFGPTELIKGYLAVMDAELKRLGVEKIRAVGDQPVHNYLAYMNRLPPYVVSTAEHGWMKSVGLTPTTELTFDWLGARRSGGGDHTLVLHQYDRHVKSWGMCSAIRRTTGLAWWKNIYTPFDAHPGVRLARIGTRLRRRMQGGVPD